jgi:predicted nuclease of restriction endonuclease-like (RecB) superfamily
MKTFDQLIASIGEVNNRLDRQARRAVNTSLTLRNWLIGFYIEEYERRGVDRAQYGERLMDAVAEALTARGLTHCDRRALYRYRSFYTTYARIVGTLSPQLISSLPAASDLVDQLSKGTMMPCEGDAQPKVATIVGTPSPPLLDRLSYSHFEQLVRLDDPARRRFYEEQCIRSTWSVRELKRQIASLYFERTALSTEKAVLQEQTDTGAEREPSGLPIRDPYVFEFLGIKPAEVMGESALEDALLDKLQAFLLELGHGFCFEARQKRFLIGESYNFVDLVFYHRVLKCHVLIELKVGPFTHEQIGQLNTYVSWYADNEMTEGDHPPFGLLLCTEKDQTVIKYALAGLNNKLFVSKYRVALPSETELARLLGEALT